MEGMLTHVARTECRVAEPHAAADCGIVSAWWWDKVQPATGATDPFVVMDLPIRN